MTTQDELMRRTFDAERDASDAVRALESISRALWRVGQDRIADEIQQCASTIRGALSEISGNRSEILNLDLAKSRRDTAEIFLALVDGAGKRGRK